VSDKLYSKIGEVAALTSLKPSILRYWETEFPQLKPVKSRAGQRLYTQNDIALIAELKRLLYGEKMTIEGARKRLRSGSRQRAAEPLSSEICNDKKKTVIDDIKQELRSLRDML